MCGIVGVLGRRAVADDIVDSLRRLEYRGYDSAGVATLEDGRLARRRAEGKLRNLEAKLAEAPLSGELGIGHTRWATHGKPTEANAHPHMSDRVAVVHNGIIENFRTLRDGLLEKGHRFQSDTDTEVIVHLIASHLNAGASPRDAVHQSLRKLEGAFALAIIFADEDNLMFGARRGSPLAVGHGDGEMYVGSDAIALAPFVNQITYLEEGDWVELTRQSASVFDMDGATVSRPITTTNVGAMLIDKGNHRHFMIKEIHQQPEVIGHTLAHYTDLGDLRLKELDLGVDLSQVPRVTISACGTAYYAGLVAKYWIEQIARIPVEIDVASEMRYRDIPLSDGGLSIFVSQSGETADTLAMLRHCKSANQRIAAVVNVLSSTIAREADVTLPILAGPEIGVASTKAFTSQLTTLAAFAIALGRANGNVSAEQEQELVRALLEVPRHVADMLRDEEPYRALAHVLAKTSDVIYLGRGRSFPIALEGALKLKEISYIHAEGYAAGELKHGPIALIDETVPVIVIAPKDELFEKTVSNMQEVAARGGRIVLISDASADEAGCELLQHIHLPNTHPFVSPLISTIPVQLLAYHTAVMMGTDVDQPRNLAKSVTVE
ncbi:MAG: glutamine--fructose-6-phosphate transaminase (isomerizing) [Pseudomonadota bacterium]